MSRTHQRMLPPVLWITTAALFLAYLAYRLWR